jgi:hypothetical protein
MTRDRECPYHYDDFGCLGEGCENEGTIYVPGIGQVCPRCYDEVQAELDCWRVRNEEKE